MFHVMCFRLKDNILLMKCLFLYFQKNKRNQKNRKKGDN